MANVSTTTVPNITWSQSTTIVLDEPIDFKGYRSKPEKLVELTVDWSWDFEKSDWVRKITTRTRSVLKSGLLGQDLHVDPWWRSFGEPPEPISSLIEMSKPDFGVDVVYI